jgi:hypothetical protein
MTRITEESVYEAIKSHITVKSLFPGMSISATNVITDYLEQEGLNYTLRCEFVNALDLLAKMDSECQVFELKNLLAVFRLGDLCQYYSTK